MICISDCHGSFYTLIRLLNKCVLAHPGDPLVFLGDLIDRGPHSRQVVEFAMGNSIPVCMGNHEDLCLAFSAHARRGFKSHCSSYYDRDVWLYNGGEMTLGNYQTVSKTGYKDGNRVPDEVLDWMQKLPAYIIPDVPVDDKGRKLLLSHNGHGLAADDGDWYRALWARDIDFPDDGYFRAFGHSPVKTAIITDTYAAIDTGAAYADRGGGNMTAFHWPSKTTIIQPFDETPVEARFRVVNQCIIS